MGIPPTTTFYPSFSLHSYGIHLPYGYWGNVAGTPIFRNNNIGLLQYIHIGD